MNKICIFIYNFNSHLFYTVIYKKDNILMYFSILFKNI